MKKFLLGVCVALLSVASSFAEKPMVTCPYCSGTGQFYVGFMSTPCISCKGTGKIVDPYYQGQQIMKEMQSKSNNSGGYNIVPMEGGTMQNGNSGSSLSYYQNALALYQQQEYQECIDFIDYDVLNNERIDTDQERIGDFYGVGANCYFELEDYQNSVDYFEKAIDYLGYDEDYYRDYVIALAYNDELEKANEKLDEAIEHGLGDDSMYFAKGEINKSLGNDSVAIENFEQCLQLTDNDELKERSYILMGDIYINNEELIEAHDVLLEGVETLPTLHQMIVLERLIQVDIDINTPVYQQEAIEKLQQVIDNNWDSYDTYDNLVILYQKLNQYDKVEENLDYMLKTFGEDYNIYKRYAFLEISLQEAKENSQRDYQQFEEYYQKAKDLYQENSTNDPEMALLDSVYQQVVSGGWL